MPPSVQARPFTGIALKVVSTLVFTAMATLIKLVSARYPVGELTFFRSFFALIPVCAWVGWRQFPGIFRTSRFGGHFVRSIAGATAMFCGFTALALLPIADATAIGYASPLMTVIFAVLLLGERVHIYRWSAVAVGLFGVLVILSDYVDRGSHAGGARRLPRRRLRSRRRDHRGARRDADAIAHPPRAGGHDRRLFLDAYGGFFAGHRTVRLGDARPARHALSGAVPGSAAASARCCSRRATASATPR